MSNTQDSKDDFEIFNDQLANRLARYHFRSVLNHSLLGLRKLWNTETLDLVKKRERVPWNILRLIIWAAKYCPEFTVARNASEGEYEQLYCQISNAPFPTRFEEPFANRPWPFLRCLLFNQLPYQTRGGKYWYLVERCIFTRCMDDYNFASVDAGFGINISELTELKYILLLYLSFSENPRFVTTAHLQKIFHRYPEEIVFAFLNQICVTHESIKAFCSDFFDTLGDPHCVYYSRFPFFDKPILKLENKYLPIDQVSSIECFNFFLYNRLRRDDPDCFPSSFGVGFQRYVDLCLFSVGHSYLGEREIANRVTGEVCDFVVQMEDCTLFVECKSMELHHGVFTNPLKQNILRAYKRSIIKGYRQITNTFEQLRKTEQVVSFVGIVLTYKFLPIGNPLDVWQEVQTECPLTEPIHERIFILSCFELETLLYRQKEQAFSMRRYFEDIVKKNQNPAGQRSSALEFLDQTGYDVTTKSKVLISIDSELQENTRRAFGE